jgi:hypothetical protein
MPASVKNVKKEIAILFRASRQVPGNPGVTAALARPLFVSLVCFCKFISSGPPKIALNCT